MNRRAIVNIIEPPENSEVIEASVKGICKGPKKRYWKDQYLLLETSGIEHKGIQIRQLVLSPRYEGDNINSILNGEKIIVGIARVLPEYKLFENDNLKSDQVEYFGIGEVQVK